MKRRLRHLFGLQRKAVRRPVTFEDLNGDVLALVVSDLPLKTRLMVSSLSRKPRMNFKPTVFRSVRWAFLRRGFPPESLHEHIRCALVKLTISPF